jgi:putative mRNA 3-end processing factor
MLRFDRAITLESDGHRLLMDALFRADEPVAISHGHSDHARDHDGEILLTKATSDVTGIEGQTIEYGRKAGFAGFDVRAHSAGHVLGSAQFEFNDETVYTGDLNTRDSILFKGAQPVPCEELLIEATYGAPHYKFPETEKAYDELQKWVRANLDAGRNVILGGYALGKAQVLTRLVTLLGITPVVHHKVHEFNQAYERHGVRLGDTVCLATKESAEIAREPFVAIMPRHAVKRELVAAMTQQYGRKAVAGVATGWSLRYGFDGVRGFCISDHADYTGLLDYVRAARPKRVFTIHGFADELAMHLRREGFNAMPLAAAEPRQATLAGFV